MSVNVGCWRLETKASEDSLRRCKVEPTDHNDPYRDENGERKRESVMHGDLLVRKSSNAIYDATHPPKVSNRQTIGDPSGAILPIDGDEAGAAEPNCGTKTA